MAMATRAMEIRSPDVEHVELSRGRSGSHLFGQVEQVVRRVAHGRDDDADRVAGALGLHDAPRHALDRLGVSDG